MDRVALAVLQAELADRHGETNRIPARIAARGDDYRRSAEGVDSMAYQLHNLYGAYEQLFETVARCFENRVDQERYHTDLLRRMKLEIDGIRPALLSASTYQLLDELRRFRHLFRHAYAVKLDADRIADLVARARQVQESFQRDTDAFLRRLAE